MRAPSEDLLGYLLDALDEPERTQVEGVLAKDAALRQRVEEFRHWVDLLAPARPMSDPPPGLAERTCQWIAAVAGSEFSLSAPQAPPTGSATDTVHASPIPEPATTTPVLEPATPAPIPELADGWPVSKLADEEFGRRASDKLPRPKDSPHPKGYGFVGKVLEDFGQLGSRGSGWRWPDLVVAGAVSLLLVFVLFGAIHYSRLRQEITQCQENLRRLGGGLIQYSELHQQQFPAIPTEGPLALAGMYGPILISGGFVPDWQAFWCPGAARRGMTPTPIPSVAQLERMDPEQRRRLLPRLGGAYGYSLGYMEAGQYRAPRNRHRAYFALLADAPSPEHPACQSFHHGGHGQNVCFEDGHVKFVVGCRLPASSDHLFLNHYGLIAPGIGPEDAVIAPGTARPNLSAAVLQSQ